MEMIYTAIDVGYHNMGLVQVDNDLNIMFSKRINITRYKCDRDCTLYHTNEVSDLVTHFIQQYNNVLSTSDVILMERQPPGGLTNVESLLFYIFRDKIKLISPNSMHAHFGIGHLTYEQRKERTVEIATKYMNIYGERKHDVADAFCIALFHIQKETISFKNKNNLNKLPFDNFRLVQYDNGVHSVYVSSGAIERRKENANIPHKERR
jgi:hypothetical protein